MPFYMRNYMGQFVWEKGGNNLTLWMLLQGKSVCVKTKPGYIDFAVYSLLNNSTI